jgi:hypothetical protein
VLAARWRRAGETALLPPVARGRWPPRWRPGAHAAWRCAATPAGREVDAAIGHRHPARGCVQTSMGMSAAPSTPASSSTGRTLARCAGEALGFRAGLRVPLLLLAWAQSRRMLGGAGCWRSLLQAAGLLAERWFFFAQARHPQNLYYQVVS